MDSWTTDVTSVIQRFVVEQTSPQEMILFIASCVGVCVLTSLLAYGCLVTLLWAARYRAKIALRSLLFPSGVKEYTVELILSALTTAALIFTFSAKEEVLQALKQHDLAACVARLDACAEEARSTESLPGAAGCACDIASLFPNEQVPESLGEKLIARVGDASASFTVSELLKPVIDAGGAQEAKRFLTALLPEARANAGGTASPFFTGSGDPRDPVGLVVFCAVLAVFQVGWLATRRFAELKRVEVAFYGGALRKLATLAVCIALLLIAPSVVLDDELVVDAAVASVRVGGAATSDDLSSTVEQVIRRQRATRSRLAMLVTPDGRSLADLVADVAADLDRLRTDHEGRLDRIPEERHSEIVASEERQEASRSRLDAAIREWHAADLARAENATREVTSLLREQLLRLEGLDRSNRAALEQAIAEGDDRVREAVEGRIEGLGDTFVTVSRHQRDLSSLQRNLDRSRDELQKAIEARATQAERGMRIYHDKNRATPLGALVVTTPQGRVAFRLGDKEQVSMADDPWRRMLPPGPYPIDGTTVAVVANRVTHHRLAYKGIE